MIEIRTERATITIATDWVCKNFNNPQGFTNELLFYQELPWATPKLLDADEDTWEIVTAKHPLAAHYPYMPVEALAELLVEMSHEGAHHRDVHPGNIVATEQGPRLIDWETACYGNGPSYDLFGPTAVSKIPEIHLATDNGYCMWWGAYEHMSIRNCWRAELPDWVIDKVRVKP